jgi:hypothetical protein
MYSHSLSGATQEITTPSPSHSSHALKSVDKSLQSAGGGVEGNDGEIDRLVDCMLFIPILCCLYLDDNSLLFP